LCPKLAEILVLRYVSQMPNLERKGYVYILVNPTFPKFVKIGKTTQDPELRARELSFGTGVPAPYGVAWDTLVTDCDQVEKIIHEKLAHVRARNDREFFAVPLKQAIAVLSEVAARFACDEISPSDLDDKEKIVLPITELRQHVEPQSTRRVTAVKGARQFIQYHNPDTMGYDASTLTEFAVFTNKPAPQDIIGSKVWLLTGSGKPRSYFLVLWFMADEVQSSVRGFKTCIRGNRGAFLKPTICLDQEEWFPGLRRSQANFVGFRRISDERFVHGLESVIPAAG
jgi:hypothetical protein